MAAAPLSSVTAVRPVALALMQAFAGGSESCKVRVQRTGSGAVVDDDKARER